MIFIHFSDRLKKISEDMWPAVLSKIDAKAVVEHTKKFEQIVFELNTYTNRNISFFEINSIL